MCTLPYFIFSSHLPIAMISLCSCGSSTEQEQSSARLRQPSHTFVEVLVLAFLRHSSHHSAECPPKDGSSSKENFFFISLVFAANLQNMLDKTKGKPIYLYFSRKKAQCLPNVWGDGWVNVGAFSFFSCLSLHRVFKGWELVSPKRVNFPVSTNIQEKAQ